MIIDVRLSCAAAGRAGHDDASRQALLAGVEALLYATLDPAHAIHVALLPAAEDVGKHLVRVTGAEGETLDCDELALKAEVEECLEAWVPRLSTAGGG